MNSNGLCHERWQIYTLWARIVSLADLLLARMHTPPQEVLSISHTPPRF